MSRLVFIVILFTIMPCFRAYTQSNPVKEAAAYTYYHPSKDKESWQRLNLWLSSAFILVKLEGQADADSCLYAASRSLGLSRYSVMAEGFSNPELAAQSKWIIREDPGAAIRLLAGATGRKHLQLLTLLGAYYAFHPRCYREYRDSVHYFLNQALQESKVLKEKKMERQALCLLGKMYAGVNDPKGDSIFNLLISQCRTEGDKETEAKALAWHGIYLLPLRSTLQTKATDLQKAAELYHSLGNIEAEINTLTDAGYMLIVTGQLPDAIDFLQRALTLEQSIHFPYTHYNTEALASATIYQSKFGEPLRYTLQSIRVAQNTRDSIGWGYFYFRLSLLYESENRYAECVDMAKKAIERFTSDNNPTVYNPMNMVIKHMNKQTDPGTMHNLIWNIAKRTGIPRNNADLLFFYNTLSGYHLYAGNLDSSEWYVHKMDSLETIAERFRGPLRRLLINDAYAMILFKRKQYRKAKKLFENHFTFKSFTDRSLYNDLNIYNWLLDVDSALNDPASAASHYKSYTQLLDSNFRVTKIRQAEELQVMYETQEKEKQIALLNEQAILVKENLKKTTIVKDLTLAGIAAALIIAVLLYRQNRLKQKNNQVVTHKNKQLQQLVTDKEWLLKEVHHRVKNNLQIVMSLLNSQAVYISNDAALTAIQDSKRRVYAMSLIHQKLYQSKNVATIGMPGYISELVRYVQQSFNSENQISFNQQVEPLELDVSQAIPIGLIINECIVNTIKYAFPDGRPGIMHIRLQYDGTDHLLLQLSDNGIGLPAGAEKKEHNSLGLDLVRGLAKQLKGHIGILNNNGLQITIRFAVIHKQISEESLRNS